MSMRLVPRATLERIWVSPRVNSAEPCTRGEMSTSHSIGRISSWARPSGRFLSLGIRVLVVSAAGVLLDDLLLHGVDRILALELGLDRGGVVDLRAVRGADL